MMISVISAVIAVLGAIAAAALGYRVQAQLKSRERMDYMGRYRDSLLWAAFDLQSRIYNILRGFDASRRPYSKGFLHAYGSRSSAGTFSSLTSATARPTGAPCSSSPRSARP
jgi:hypothetical protein